MKKNRSIYLSEFLSFIDNVNAQYTYNLEKQKEQESLTQDLLHKLELGDISYNERCKVATQLKINRKDRRYYKDIVEELEPVYSLLNGPDGLTVKKTINQFKQTLGAMRKQENYHAERFYTPKVLKNKKEGNI